LAASSAVAAFVFGAGLFLKYGATLRSIKSWSRHESHYFFKGSAKAFEENSMRKLMIALGLGAALIFGATPAPARTFYFGFSSGPYYGGGYYYYGHRHYRRYHRHYRYYYHRHYRYYYRHHHRRYYRPRVWGYSPYTGRWTRDINEIHGCFGSWTYQDGVCKPYRGY
jgi:hypothetical protein